MLTFHVCSLYARPACGGRKCTDHKICVWPDPTGRQVALVQVTQPRQEGQLAAPVTVAMQIHMSLPPTPAPAWQLSVLQSQGSLYGTVHAHPSPLCNIAPAQRRTVRSWRRCTTSRKHSQSDILAADLQQLDSQQAMRPPGLHSLRIMLPVLAQHKHLQGGTHRVHHAAFYTPGSSIALVSGHFLTLSTRSFVHMFIQALSQLPPYTCPVPLPLPVRPLVVKVVCSNKNIRGCVRR